MFKQKLIVMVLLPETILKGRVQYESQWIFKNANCKTKI